MIVKNRIDEILKILNRDGKILVKDMSELFNVTEDLIRKDLKKLEQNDTVRRIYGGAVLQKEKFIDFGLNQRKTEDVESKTLISEKAVKLIEDGDHIFMDISSTNLILASFIAKSEKNITVITNMPDIIKVLSDSENIKLIGVGGNYDSTVGGFIGSSAVDAIRKYRVDKAFLGCCGLNLSKNSLSSVNIEDGFTKKAIMDIAVKSYVLMENSKFTKEGIYSFSNLNNLEGVITEGMPDKFIEELLEERELKLF